MKDLFGNIGAWIRKHREITAVAAGLLALVLLTASMVGALSTQAAAEMENPIRGIAEGSMLVQLTGTKEVVAEAPRGSSQEQEHASSDEEQAEPEQEREETTDDSGSDSGNDSASQVGSGAAGGQGDEHSDNKGSNPSKQDNDNKNLNDSGDRQQYFTTSIVDGDTLTDQQLEYSISYLTDLKVKQVRDSVNGDPFSQSTGSLKLAVGENKVTVRVTFIGADGKSFDVDKSYTIYVDPENIIITVRELTDGGVTEKPTCSFKAYAKQAGEQVELQIRLENSEGSATQSTMETEHSLELAEGENKIYLSAEKDGTIKEADPYPYTIIYEPPYEEQLWVWSDDLDQVNGTVTHSMYLEFQARGMKGSTPVSLELAADWHDTQLQELGNDNYLWPLSEGENRLTLTPYDGETQGEPVTYTVTFTKDASQTPGGGVPNGPKAPTISCPDLDGLNGQTIANSQVSFMLYATDYMGYPADTRGMSVLCNQVPAGENWVDPGAASYTVTLSEGTNIIEISVEDGEGNWAYATYTIDYVPEDPNKPIGSITLSVEATTIGLGNLLGPMNVEITQNQRLSEVLDTVLQNYGYIPGFRGNYLACIDAGFDFVYPQIPADLAEKLTEACGFDPENYPYYSNSLGEFDICSKSGWMYSVDGNYPNYGMGDCILQPGQVIRVRFTTYMGADIGGSGAMGNGAVSEGDAPSWGKEW